MSDWGTANAPKDDDAVMVAEVTISLPVESRNLELFRLLVLVNEIEPLKEIEPPPPVVSSTCRAVDI